MDCVERCYEFTIKRERVRLNEPERIIRLRLDIDADNIKSGSAVSDSGTASATEKVEKAGLIPVRRRFGHGQSQRTFPPDMTENNTPAPASRSH